MLQGTDGAAARAKALRRRMSPAEIKLWPALRERPNGLKFRRQHPSGPYVADFYCHSARLVIEVDGKAHDYGDRPVHDAARDAWFACRGIATLRIPARDVFDDLDAVVAHIVVIAAKLLSAVSSAFGEEFRRKLIAIGAIISAVSSTSAALAAVAVDHLLHG